jgi:hypothetical protein
MKMIRHVVLINWKEGIPASELENWISLCNRIPDECPMVYNWFSSYGIPGPDPTRPSTHDFCLHFDLRSRDDWEEYLRHEFPNTVYSEGEKIIDLARTASTNMIVEAEPNRSTSRTLSRSLQDNG